MKGELTEGDVLFESGVNDESLGQLGAFTQGDHPAGDIPAEDFEEFVEIEIGQFGWAVEVRDIPEPELVEGRGNEFSFESCSHSAGRVMSRTDAFRSVSEKDFKSYMEGVLYDYDDRLKDESPLAYKNSTQVLWW